MRTTQVPATLVRVMPARKMLVGYQKLVLQKLIEYDGQKSPKCDAVRGYMNTRTIVTL